MCGQLVKLVRDEIEAERAQMQRYNARFAVKQNPNAALIAAWQGKVKVIPAKRRV